MIGPPDHLLLKRSLFFSCMLVTWFASIGSLLPKQLYLQSYWLMVILTDVISTPWLCYIKLPLWSGILGNPLPSLFLSLKHYFCLIHFSYSYHLLFRSIHSLVLGNVSLAYVIRGRSGITFTFSVSAIPIKGISFQ